MLDSKLADLRQTYSQRTLSETDVLVEAVPQFRHLTCVNMLGPSTPPHQVNFTFVAVVLPHLGQGAYWVGVCMRPPVNDFLAILFGRCIRAINHEWECIVFEYL